MNRTNVRETIGTLLGVCYASVTNGKHSILSTLVAGILCSFVAFAQGGGQYVVLGGVRHSASDSIVTSYSIEAATALALELTGKYRLIPNSVRDSLVNVYAATDPLTAQRAADLLGAEIILFLNVQRVANLLRVEVALVGGEGWIVSSSGIGYAVAVLRDNTTGKLIADPALLAATQRALCGALLERNLYAAADSEFVVTPTRLAAVGSVVFSTADTALVPWSVVREKIPASYDVASTIVAALRAHDTITVVDLESRDSLYAMAGLYMVENYNPLTSQELKILRGFDVETIITGEVTRVRGGATVTLHINAIGSDMSYTPVKSASARVTVDSKRALQDGVRECLRTLFGKITEPRAR